MSARLEVAIVNLGGFDWRRRTSDRTFAFLPYVAGILEAYVRRHARDPERYSFRLPMFRRGPVDVLAGALAGLDVAGFSAYCWNIELSLAVARRLRRLSPRTQIVFGGPHVPDGGKPFLELHPFIDAAVHGEGEATFLAWLEADDEGRAHVAGVTRRTPAGIVSTPKPSRIRDLTTIPSPYLDGVFERVIAANPGIRWHALWETNRGCPFACTFCDWGSATATKVYQFALGRVLAEIDWMAEHHVELLFCCDANFGLLPRDVQIAEYLHDVRARTGWPASTGVQNTKNATERAYTIQRWLAASSPNGVTLSMQSLDAATLKAIKRDNISLRSFEELQRRFACDGIDTYTDIILGLPGETYDSYRDGIAAAIANGQHHRIHFYNCSVLPNAEMAQPAYRAEHGLVTTGSRLMDAYQPISRAGHHVDEYLDIVVGTRTMPREDWVRGKAFWWMTELLHCDRVLHIALVTLHAEYGLDFGRMIERFVVAEAARFPVIAGVAAMFVEKARAIQQGDGEYIPSETWLGVYWPADQYALIDLVTSFTIETFYQEARELLGELLPDRSTTTSRIVSDAITLNAALLKVPFEIDDLEVALEFDVWECYRDVVTGRKRRPRASGVGYRIIRTRPIWLSSAAWCEDLLSRSTRKQSFLYPIESMNLCPNADTTAFQARVLGPSPAATARHPD